MVNNQLMAIFQVKNRGVQYQVKLQAQSIITQKSCTVLSVKNVKHSTVVLWNKSWN